MKRKIINLSPAKEDYGCIICCNGHATTKVEILRLVVMLLYLISTIVYSPLFEFNIEPLYIVDIVVAPFG